VTTAGESALSPTSVPILLILCFVWDFFCLLSEK